MLFVECSTVLSVMQKGTDGNDASLRTQVRWQSDDRRACYACATPGSDWRHAPTLPRPRWGQEAAVTDGARSRGSVGCAGGVHSQRAGDGGAREAHAPGFPRGYWRLFTILASTIETLSTCMPVGSIWPCYSGIPASATVITIPAKAEQKSW